MEWELVTLQSLDITLEGVLTLPGAEQPCPVLIVCHGYLRSRQDYTVFCNYLGERGIATLALDMHGHGGSGGNRYAMTVKEWLADVRAATIFLRSHPRVSSSIGVLGHCSGGTAALEAAILDAWLKVVVAVAPRVSSPFQFPIDLFFWLFTQLGWVIRGLSGSDLRISLGWIVRRMRLAVDPQDDRCIKADPHFIAGLRKVPFPSSAQSRYVRTLQRVPRLTAPVLMVWGEQDRVIPFSQARSLWNSLRSDKDLISLPNCGHYPLWEGEKEKVWERVGDWLEKKMEVR